VTGRFVDACLTSLDIAAPAIYHGGMKTFIRALGVGVIFAVCAGTSRADSGYSFGFTVQQKHIGGTKVETYDESIKNLKWSYAVTMENKSFKDVQDIQIKYVMFSIQQQVGVVTTGRQNLQRHTGTVSIKVLKNNDTITFNTDAILLKTVDYYDGYYADEQAKGALRGLWIRVYVGGQMVYEFMDPQNLSNKETFDPPPKGSDQ
jgi:hypothetical protein